jgi:hypothetical protein
MADYTPTYRKSPLLTIEHPEDSVGELKAIHAYATGQDDLLALDELFCRIVSLEHRLATFWESTRRHAPQAPRPEGMT